MSSIGSGPGNVPQSGLVASTTASPTPPRVQFQEDFFVYNVDFVAGGVPGAIAHGATQNGNFQIEASSDFKLIKLAYFADIAAAAMQLATLVVPNVTLQITDSGSGRNLFNGAIPVPSIFGQGNLPFILPLPRIFRARSNIQIVATNFDAAVDYNLRLAFIGTKIFQLGQ